MNFRIWILCLLLSFCSIASYAGSNSLPPRTTPQGLEGGFWRTEDNFEPTLRLKNILLKQSLVVTPSLYFADGTEYRLPPVTLSPAGIGRVSIRYALQNAPAAIRSHISTYGMAAISYQWSWPAVIASIQSTDEIASLTLVSSFQADVRKVHTPGPATQQIVRGTWWLPTDNADYSITLGNSSLTPKSIEIAVTGHDGSTLAQKQLVLQKHAVQLIHLSDIFGQINIPDKMGGIEIHYSGAERSVVSYASIVDATVGYSASPFLTEDRPLPPKPDHIATISAPGIMLGHADPAMLFPVGTVFSPFAILHNVSNHSLNVNMQLDTQGTAGAPQSRALNPVSLAPGETMQYDFNSQFPNANPLPDGYGALSASFQGQDGDLRVQSGSIDQSQSYVFEVPASLQAATVSRTLCFWSIEGDNDTMVAVWNYEAVPQDLVLTLHYATGKYAIPIHLGPREAYNLDLMSLVRSHLPDPTGTLIPSNIDSGSAVLSGVNGELDRISVSVATSIFNVRNATCGYGCITCDGEVSLQYSTSPLKVGVTKTLAATVQLTMGDGSVITNPAGTWQTSNTAVATVNSNGVHTGVSAGTATSYFIVQVPVNTTICGPPDNLTCPDTSETATDQVDVPVATVTVNGQGNYPYGQDPSITAGVLDNNKQGPTGTVTFSMSPAAVQSSTAPVGAGYASWTLAVPLTALPVNNYAVTAVYSGDTTYAPAQGSGTFAINKAQTEATINDCSSPLFVTAGEKTWFTVGLIPTNPQIQGSTPPSGNVTLTAAPNFQGGKAVTFTGLLSGTEASVGVTLGAGNWTVSAGYQGDTNYVASPTTPGCSVTAE